MKRLIVPLFIVIAAAAFASASSASAQEGRHMSPQQEKFAACAHQSKGMKREEHKKFMSECLKGKGKTTKPTGNMGNSKNKAAHTVNKTESRRGKMKACNAEAGSKKLTGKQRKTFMRECLKGGMQK